MVASEVNSKAQKPADEQAKHLEAGQEKTESRADATHLSQSALIPGDPALKVLTARSNELANSAALHHFELTDSAKPVAEQKLSHKGVDKAGQDLKEALFHRNLWGVGFSAPEAERLRNILEPLKAIDRKAVEAAYEKSTGHKLSADLEGQLGKNSEEFKRINGIMQRKDGQSDEATHLTLMIDRVNGATQNLAARDNVVVSALAATQPGASLAKAIADMRDASTREKSLTEVERTIGTLSSTAISDLKKETGRDFEKELLANPNLSKDEKDTLKILLQGVDKRNGSDPESLKNFQQLSEIALRTKDAALLKDTLQSASPQAREQFAKADGLKQIADKFSADDSKMLTEYAQRGQADVARMVNGNDHWYHTNRDEIERLVNTASNSQREQFRQELASGNGKIDAGNARENALWEAKLAGNDKITADLLESHKDGVIFGWGAKTDQNKLFSAVEQISEADWNRLKADHSGLTKVDSALKIFATDEERKAIIAKLQEKLEAPSYQDSKALGRRTAAEVFGSADSTPQERLNSLTRMSENECKLYRLDEGSARHNLDKLVETNTQPGLERDEAKRLLTKVMDGQKPDNFDQAIIEAVSAGNPAQIAKQIEAGFARQPEMLERLHHPATPEDKLLAGNLRSAMDTAVDKAGYGDTVVSGGEYAQVIPGRYDEFSGDLFNRGRMPLDLKVQLEPDKVARLQDIASAGAEDRARLLKNPPGDLATSNFQSVISGDLDKTLVRTVAQQGQFTAADRIRAFVTDAGGASDDLKATLTKMSSEQRQDLANEYFTKYGKLATDDLIAKVPDQDKYRFRELMAPTDVSVRQIALDTREENQRHDSAFDPLLNRYWDKSQEGAQEAQSNMDKFLKDHAADIDKLDPADKAKFNESVSQYQQALKNYLDSKGKFAEGVVDAGITVAAIGGSVFSGGTSLGLLAAVGTGGAAFRVAGMRAIEGSDFDGSAENIARQAFKGFTAAELGFVSPQALGLKGLVKVGDQVATSTAEKVMEQAAASGIAQTAFKESAQATEAIIGGALSDVTRQTAISGSKELGAQAQQIATRVLSDSATPAQRQAFEQTLQQQLKEQTTKTLRDKVINEAESALLNVGVASGSNVATEVAATAAGFEDPKTLWQRASDSALSGAIGAAVFHVAFKGIGAGFKGGNAVLGKDGAGIFAGEGTVVRHADGTHSVVPEGGKYRFQPGETVAEASVEGASGTRIEFKGVDDNSRRAEVHHATLTEGGATRDVVFHTPEPDHFATSSDAERMAERLGKETTAAKLNREIGFDANYPESKAYSTQIDGKPVQGWIQDSAGKPITQELKDAVIKRFGSLDEMDEHLPQLLQEQPQLRNDLTNAAVERIVYGDRDINTSNITRGADGKIHNIDMGHAFSDEPAIDLHSYRQNLTDISLLKALSEQPIPADTRAKLQAFADKYKSDEAIDRLAKETGSPRERIVESVQRARQLADSGHLPEVNARHVTEDNIDFFRIAERSSRIRSSAETPVVPEAQKAVPGQRTGTTEKPILE